MDGIACAILAGGRGLRLGGVEKGLVPVAGRPLLDHVLDRVRGSFDSLLLVTRRPAAYAGRAGLRVVADELSEPCPLSGLHAALRSADRPWVFATSCDMPAVSTGLVERLARERAGADVVLPVSSAGDEPLHALYTTACAPMIASAAARGDWKMTSFHPEARVRRIAVADGEWRFRGLSPFTNLNTQQDFDDFQNVIAMT